MRWEEIEGDRKGITSQLLCQKKLSPVNHYVDFLSLRIRKHNCKRYPRFQYLYFQSTPALSWKTCSQQVCRTARLRSAGCGPQPGTVQADLPTSAREYFLLFHPVAHACNLPNPSFVSSQSCPCCWCQRPALSVTPMDDEGSAGKSLNTCCEPDRSIPSSESLPEEREVDADPYRILHFLARKPSD